ncbi:21165_t:CDS:2, partial [Entrophospora sp. SA101]
KRKEVENRYQQNYKELNKKHRERSQSYNKIYEEIVKITKLISSLKEEEEEAAHEIVDSDANYKLKKLENKYKNIGESIIKIEEKKKKEPYQRTFQEFDEFEQNLTAISDEFENNQKHALLNLVKGFNDNKVEDDQLLVSVKNNHVDLIVNIFENCRKIEIVHLYQRFKNNLSIFDTNEILERSGKIGLPTSLKHFTLSAYQRTFQEFDEFEQNLTAISDEFENNQKHALLNLVKGFNDNKVEDDHDEKDEKPQEITNNNDVERKNKRKIEKEVEGEEVSTSKKVKYVAAGAGIAGLLSLAPWVLDNLPLLQQHLQNLPFI